MECKEHGSWCHSQGLDRFEKQPVVKEFTLVCVYKRMAPCWLESDEGSVKKRNRKTDYMNGEGISGESPGSHVDVFLAVMRTRCCAGWPRQPSQRT